MASKKITGMLGSIFKKMIIFLLACYFIQLIIAMYFCFIPMETKVYPEMDITLKAYRGYGFGSGIIPGMGLLHYFSDHGRVIAKMGDQIEKTDFDVYEVDANLNETKVVRRDSQYIVEFPNCCPIYFDITSQHEKLDNKE